jgi:hypothetical protein
MFYVNNQSLTLSSAQKNIEIASDSKNYLIAKFVFQTSDWKNDIPKYALFTHNGKTYKKYLGIEEGLESNECYVAPEVIKEGGFIVSLFGEEYASTKTVKIPVVSSGYTESLQNFKPTPSVEKQMNTLLYNYAKVCNDILKECQQIKEELKGRENE